LCRADERAVRMALLGTRLTAPVSPCSAWVGILFEDQVRPLLSTLDIKATLLEVRTPSRFTTCKTIEGRQFVVFDHSLLRRLRVLDWLVNGKAPKALAAAAFQQILQKRQEPAVEPMSTVFRSSYQIDAPYSES